VWTFLLQNPTVRFDGRETFNLQLLKIVVADHKVAKGEDKLTPIEPPP
jgi:hypothetical protein